MVKAWGSTQEHLDLRGVVGCENVPLILNPFPTYFLLAQEITYQLGKIITPASSGFLLVPRECSLTYSEYLKQRWESLSIANQERLAKRHREIGEYLCLTDFDVLDPASSLEVSNLEWL